LDEYRRASQNNSGKKSQGISTNNLNLFRFNLRTYTPKNKLVVFFNLVKRGIQYNDVKVAKCLRE
jgi:hypothetical protein